MLFRSEVSKLRRELADKLVESQAAHDGLRKAEELQQQAQKRLESVTSELEEAKRTVESSRAIIGEKDKSIAKLDDELKTLRVAATRSPASVSQTLFEEPGRMESPSPPPAEGRPESIRSGSAGRLTAALLESTGIFSKVNPLRKNTKRKTFFSVAQDMMALGNGSSASGVGGTG